MWARRVWLTDDGLLRTPWRLAIFIIVAVVATVAAEALLYPIGAAVSALIEVRLILFAWVAVVGLLIAHHVSLRRIDRLPWGAAGLGAADARPSLIAQGLVVGALAIGVPSLGLWSMGWFRLEPQPEGSSLAAAVRLATSLAPAAFYEELLVRGYPLAALRKVLDWRIAVALTSVVFGALHAWNPGATLWSLSVVVVAGFMLGTIVVVTGSLYAATAAHFAWNWVMAGLLHMPVSGLPFATPDFRLVDSGPDWATGGSWGPEAGAGAVLGMGAATVYTYARWRRRTETND